MVNNKKVDKNKVDKNKVDKIRFMQGKEKALGKSDRSNIGEWDPKIIGLCEKINKKKDYYTTSSCAGRVILLKGEGKKQPDVFLYRCHERVSFEEIKKGLEDVDKKKYMGMVWFKQSPCILHVCCLTLENAEEMLKKAKECGWKHSGIMTFGRRIIVELHSTEQIELPVMENGEMLVSDEFLKVLVEESNGKLERVWEKIERLRKVV